VAAVNAVHILTDKVQERFLRECVDGVAMAVFSCEINLNCNNYKAI
jgi:hypothetical protein